MGAPQADIRYFCDTNQIFEDETVHYALKSAEIYVLIGGLAVRLIPRRRFNYYEIHGIKKYCRRMPYRHNP